MPMRLRIITDSSASFTVPRMLAQYPVTVIPNRLLVGGKSYRDGADLAQDEMLRLIATQAQPPRVLPPTTAEFAAAYAQAARSADAILSIHPSREMNASWHNGLEASQQVSGPCPIAVVDSRSVCNGQGMLVKFASERYQQQPTLPFDALVQQVRRAAERLYTQYFVETTPFIQANGLLNAPHALLATLLAVKPLLSIEDGRLQVVEKTRTRSQAIDRLVEFVAEFDALADVAIVQPRQHVSEATRILQERLALVFPGRHFPHAPYNPTLAALIGVDALGIAILEHESDEL